MRFFEDKASSESQGIIPRPFRGFSLSCFRDLNLLKCFADGEGVAIWADAVTCPTSRDARGNEMLAPKQLGEERRKR